MLTRIDVTRNDIVNGHRDNAECCPVALAVKRRVPKSMDVTVVGPHLTLFPKGRPFFEIKTPEEVSDFVDEFDAGLPVRPFSFDLEIPEEVF